MSLQRFLLLFLFPIILLSCDEFVNDVEPPIDQIDSDKLTDESQMRFLIAGVQQRFATTYDQTIVLADGLSDAFFFDLNVPGATFFSFEDIDFADIRPENASVEAQFQDLGELRFLADDLLRRARELQFSDADLRREVFFTGHFYGGIARYLLAAYCGLTETEGGGVIDNGPFLPSAQMYQQAADRLQSALNHSNDPYERRVTNSIIARAYLFNGERQRAQSFAGDGMIAGDAPFRTRYSPESANFYWSQAGRGQTQFVADDRFADYIFTEPAETTRVKIEGILGFDDETVFWRQIRYPEIDSPIPFMTWQENELMLAELDFFGGAMGPALARINLVRASFGLDDLDRLDLETLLAEREKTMFAQGLRLVDQRRFNEFHIEGGWQYLPIPETERLNNPNLN